MSFIEDFIKTINTVPTYEVKKEDGTTVKTIRCDTVCDILTVLFDKYGFEEKMHDDLHG